MPGLFPSAAVHVTEVFSPQLTDFMKKLARAVTDESDHPTAKFKLGMCAAIHNRGGEEVSAYQVQAFNEMRSESMPAVSVSTCVLEFSLTETTPSVCQTMVFKCPPLGGGDSELGEFEVKILPPRLGPNLVERTEFSFEPSSFVLGEGGEEEVDVCVSLIGHSSLETSTSVLVPILFKSEGKTLRFFLLCELTTPQLSKVDRLSMLVSEEVLLSSSTVSHQQPDRPASSSSELWGETMTSSDLASAGINDLLSDLLVMPVSKKPVPPARSPRPSVLVHSSPVPPLMPSFSPSPPVPSSSTSSGATTPVLSSRASDSNIVPKQVSRVATNRGRTASGGNQEEMGSESSSSNTSPRGVLANVRARLTRNRSNSSGTEEEKARKSPRSPRLEDVSAVSTSLSPVLRKQKSQGERLEKSPPVLEAPQRREPVVRKREPSEVERKPGWVASLDRRNSPKLISSPLMESTEAIGVDLRTTPPKKKLPSVPEEGPPINIELPEDI